jgi:WD40 repeat protein
VQQAVFSPDGTTVATASWDHDVRLWDAATGEHLTTITAHEHIAWAAAFSPDGRTLATTGGNTILWDLSDRRNPRKLTVVPGGVYVVLFSPDGSRLVSSAWVQDLRDTPLAGHEDFATDVEYRPDGRFLASSGWDRLVRLWEPGKPLPVATLTGGKPLLPFRLLHPGRQDARPRQRGR